MPSVHRAAFYRKTSWLIKCALLLSVKCCVAVSRVRPLKGSPLSQPVEASACASAHQSVVRVNPAVGGALGGAVA